jgi:hypothetical protein
MSNARALPDIPFSPALSANDESDCESEDWLADLKIFFRAL